MVDLKQLLYLYCWWWLFIKWWLL